ncbi:CBS domain-containing protein [Paraliobacillus quinghaiensis]|uniref:CBS domain-containing protein n=1 Tax=Paraliobacillus quinghaiensis TaxID=470815 RepID=A0A917WQ23_9BACI|nr:CBS domain-containing protein [Paraliobacillus quinghaiensis]GGM20419.1 CBS domain-containing protein [Paraliobacillus quinghaiensis]
MKTVKEIMAQDVVYCTSNDSLIDAAKKMTENNVGAIPVCEQNQELRGMVTDRDLVVRGYAKDKPGTTKINEVMTDHLVSAEPTTSVQEASAIMAEHQIRRLPIVEQKKLVGIVALGDLALEEKSNLAAGHALEEISEHPEVH